MSTKKSFKDLAKEMEGLQENELGQLKGGFSSFKTLSAMKDTSAGSVTVTVRQGTTCSCTCKVQ